jgi:hypothetical protein
MGDEDARTAATPIFAEGRPEAEVAVPRCRPKSGWNPLGHKWLVAGIRVDR